jgi:hypothetical protein
LFPHIRKDFKEKPSDIPPFNKCFFASMVPLPENYAKHSLVLPFFICAGLEAAISIDICRKRQKPPSYGEKGIALFHPLV